MRLIFFLFSTVFSMRGFSAFYSDFSSLGLYHIYFKKRMFLFGSKIEQIISLRFERFLSLTGKGFFLSWEIGKVE
jgi:hypothetical protein